MFRKKHLIIPFIFLLGAMLSGCTFVQIENYSAVQARVLVNVPDSGSSYTRSINPEGAVSVFTGNGGRYRVTTLEDEEYRNLLLDMQQEISNRLFTEGATLTVDDISHMVNMINQIDQALASLAARAGVTCTGTVSDFETAIVVLIWDTAAGQWSLTCP